MRALRSFTVRARLPEALGPLQELAFNLRWSWDDRTQDLFRWVDPQTWELTFHDPVRLLGLVGRHGWRSWPPTRLHGLPGRDRRRPAPLPGGAAVVPEPRDQPLRAVAYFSPEFGIAEALPQYSGGLGVLAGDHLKAASGLGIPLIGVGLLYRHGLFPPAARRRRLAGGALSHAGPAQHGAGAGRGGPDRRSISAGAPLEAQVWRARVGRVALYLLDADVEANDDDLRAVTDRLYGGDNEHRLRQEILLGMGGVRALEAAGRRDPGLPYQRGPRRVSAVSSASAG